VAVRHVTCKSNVDEDGFLHDAALVHHGSIEGGVLAALGGPVDPLTHNNLDFPEHEIGECVIVQALEIGSRVVRDEEGLFARARIRPGSKQRLGRVNTGARRAEWLQRFSHRSHPC
jgi:hypothetical protein